MKTRQIAISVLILAGCQSSFDNAEQALRQFHKTQQLQLLTNATIRERNGAYIVGLSRRNAINQTELSALVEISSRYPTKTKVIVYHDSLLGKPKQVFEQYLDSTMAAFFDIGAYAVFFDERDSSSVIFLTEDTGILHIRPGAVIDNLTQRYRWKRLKRLTDEWYSFQTAEPLSPL